MRGSGEKTKSALLDAAIELMSEQGVDEISIDQICKAAGVAKGTFYLYFPSKDALVGEVYQSGLDIYRARQLESFLANNQQATNRQKAEEYFLISLQYAAYTGWELVARAYASNFMALSRQGSREGGFRVFADATFEKERDLLIELFGVSAKEAEETLLSLDIVLSGAMAFWSMRRGTFDIVAVGRQQVIDILDRISQGEESDR